MPTLTRQILDNLQERLDEDLLPALYAAVSVPTQEIRASLTERQMPWFDPLAEHNPSLHELDLSAKLVLERSRRRASLISAAGAIGGAATVPSEVLASLTHTLRLAQRLSVVYGFDPETDHGHMMVWRAMAAAFEIDMPEQGQMNMKVRDLPATLSKNLPATQNAAAWMTRAVVRRSVRTITRRITRMLPGMDVGLSVWSASRRQAERGERMISALRRAWEGEPLGRAVEADVVR